MFLISTWATRSTPTEQVQYGKQSGASESHAAKAVVFDVYTMFATNVSYKNAVSSASQDRARTQVSKPTGLREGPPRLTLAAVKNQPRFDITLDTPEEGQHTYHGIDNIPVAPKNDGSGATRNPNPPVPSRFQKSQYVSPSQGRASHVEVRARAQA